MKPYHVVWKGPVHKASGLGRASRAYAQSLKRQGVAVSIGAAQQRKNGSRYTRVLIYHHLPNSIQWKKSAACMILLF